MLILMLNPALEVGDYETCKNQHMRDAIISSVQQTSACTCIAFDPKFAFSTWFAYYERAFRQVLLEVAKERHERTTYLDALNWFATNCAILQLVPYFSVDSSSLKLGTINNLESCKSARQLATAALDEGKLVFVRWGAHRWDLRRSGENLIVNTGLGLASANARNLAARVLGLWSAAEEALPGPKA